MHRPVRQFVRSFNVNLFAVPVLESGCNDGRTCRRCIRIVCVIYRNKSDDMRDKVNAKVWVMMLVDSRERVSIGIRDLVIPTAPLIYRTKQLKQSKLV